MKKAVLKFLVALCMISCVTACSRQDENAYNAGENKAPTDVSEYVSSNQSETPPDQTFSDDINTDILSRHLLPPFERMEKADRAKFVENLQVYRKISELELDDDAFLYPEKNLETLRNTMESVMQDIPEALEKVYFSGTTSMELQDALNANAGKALYITSPKVTVTSRIEVPSDTYLIGGGTEFETNGCDYTLVVENVKNVVLDSIRICGDAEYGVFIAGSENVVVSGCEITGMKQKAICVTAESSLFCIQNNEITRNGAGGIYCAGNVSKGFIRNNIVSNNMGTSNWMAGIVLSNAATENPLNIWEKFDVNHRCPTRDNLYLQTSCAHEILVENNTVSQNNASGIYSDGSYRCYILNNDIIRNDKEGICLDNGTIGTYLKENLVKENGGRYRQTDDDLRMDYVLDAGRMEDGSAKSKLPGISLDNTAYNILENNIVTSNYGGGIKMVRSTIRCLISENIIKDNNKGQNDLFHFFGIELGAAIPDEPVPDMDFTSDFENIVCRNTISGGHYSGVFLGEDCYVNDVFDNVIMEPQMFAIECVSVKFNSIINNFSNMEIRNEYKEQ